MSRRFGRRWALRAIHCRVMPGEVLGIMGHNGSGKSTLLRVISTALRPTLGGGTVFGYDIAKEASAVRSLCGFLAHAPGLYEDLTARENLKFSADMYGLGTERIDGILERVGLWNERDERVRGFSAGMQRRLALGRLTLQGPRLLLLDEPYNNFDSAGVELLNEVIRETRDRGGAALLVLHDGRQAEQIVDRTVVLGQGRIIRVEPGIARGVSDSASPSAEWAAAGAAARGA